MEAWFNFMEALVGLVGALACIAAVCLLLNPMGWALLAALLGSN
jgi:hypothetical protein